MIPWRDYRHLLLALLASLLLHLVFGYGLNVYGNGQSIAKTPTRLTLRLARSPKPLAEPALASPLAVPPADPRPVLAVPASRLKLPVESSEVTSVAPKPAATPADVPVDKPEPLAALPEPPLPNMPTIGVLEVPEIRFLPANEVDVVAKPAAPIVPNFPIQLQRSDVKGMVIILLKIDETGVVVNGEIEFADPPGMFDQMALGPFISARYTPAQKNGLPVRSEKRIEVIFGDYQRPLLGPPLPPKP